MSLLVFLLAMMIGVWLNSLRLKSQSGGVSEASGLVYRLASALPSRGVVL